MVVDDDDDMGEAFDDVEEDELERVPSTLSANDAAAATRSPHSPPQECEIKISVWPTCVINIYENKTQAGNVVCNGVTHGRRE